MDLSFDPGSGVNGPVFVVFVQPDGKALIGGRMTMVRGVKCQDIARLNADGSGDSSFTLGDLNTGISQVVAIAKQSDGKVLVGHGNGLSRLNPDGHPDRGFIAPTLLTDGLFPASVNWLAVLPDDRILIAGGFFSVNGALRPGIARLHADGSLDSTFDPGSGLNGEDAGVYCGAVQRDGKVLIGGYFLGFNGTVRSNIARLNADGSLDHAFGGALDDSMWSIAIQPDDKVLIGGWFTTVNGESRSGIARLNADGSLDRSFDPGGTASIYSVALQSDGKVLIGGGFLASDGTKRYLARLNADGSLDGSFDPDQSRYYPGVASLAVQPDGKVLVSRSKYFGDEPDYYLLTRLNVNGSLDSTFTAGGGIQRGVDKLIALSEGKVLIAGGFSFVDGISRGGIARLNADGSLDHSFVPDPGIRSVTTMERQPDGTLLVGGYGGTAGAGIARLDADGSLDKSFDPGTGLNENGFVRVIAIESDGKVLIGGEFDTVNGTYRHGMARLNSDGSLDASFNLHRAHTGGSIESIVAQPDGKVLVGGYFGIEGEANYHLIARLQADGSLDRSFTFALDGQVVYFVLLQPDGKLLIAGRFWAVDEPIDRGFRLIARLNADGSLDGTFNAAHGTGNIGGLATPPTLALQPDGKVVAPGDYFLGKDGNDLSYQGVIRLHPDGDLDRSFIPRFDPPWSGTSSVALESDGGVLVCGDIFVFHGVLRPYMARLHGDAASRSSFLRGDCNDDGRVDLSDAVCILNWLFFAGAGPGCLAVANMDGVGAVDITDPIYLLTHLFLGGPAPVAPYPVCGTGTLPEDEGTCKTPPEGCPQ
ncbi:MAG TPA: hypothetical protein VGR67_04725 [Candidatus Polarisedimenticolia bacterium]|nr:hypothetical protein [Candidatus Polarisedimenticolia bacterium]